MRILLLRRVFNYFLGKIADGIKYVSGTSKVQLYCIDLLEMCVQSACLHESGIADDSIK